jgi:hypothetical protein
MRHVDTCQQLRSVRKYFAAVLLLIAMFDVSSNVLASVLMPPACADLHYSSNGVDCPHKRERRSPDRGAFDDTTHLAVLQPADEPEVIGSVYSTETPFPLTFRIVTRSVAPPFQPPRA